MSNRQHRRHRVRRHVAPKRTPPGAHPGTVVVDPAAPATTIRVMAYGPDALVVEEIRNPNRLREFVGKYPVTWVDVTGLGDPAALEKIAEIFQLHPLAMEDIVHADQRAKVEEYGSHLLFVVVRLLAQQERLTSMQISLFVGANSVLSFQERSTGAFQPVRERIKGSRGRIRSSGSDYLAYALIDAVVDGYFPVMEAFGERLDAFDDDLTARTAGQVMTRIHDARGDLLLLRRTLWPHREAINELLRDPHAVIASDTRIYLRDCYDNVVQLIDLAETYREFCADLRDEALSFTSARLNEIMKVLTIISTIFMPLSFIVGLYGMNFDTSKPWNMPELHWTYGYPFVLGVLAAVVGGMLLFFRRRGWLGSTAGIEGPAGEGIDFSSGGVPRDMPVPTAAPAPPKLPSASASPAPINRDPVDDAIFELQRQKKNQPGNGPWL